MRCNRDEFIAQRNCRLRRPNSFAHICECDNAAEYFSLRVRERTRADRKLPYFALITPELRVGSAQCLSPQTVVEHKKALALVLLRILAGARERKYFGKRSQQRILPGEHRRRV